MPNFVPTAKFKSVYVCNGNLVPKNATIKFSSRQLYLYILLCKVWLVHFLGLCKIYEEYLRQMNPHSPSITYDISELFKFIDNLYDLSCLV